MNLTFGACLSVWASHPLVGRGGSVVSSVPCVWRFAEGPWASPSLTVACSVSSSQCCWAAQCMVYLKLILDTGILDFELSLYFHFNWVTCTKHAVAVHNVDNIYVALGWEESFKRCYVTALEIQISIGNFFEACGNVTEEDAVLFKRFCTSNCKKLEGMPGLDLFNKTCHELYLLEGYLNVLKQASA